MGKRRGVGTDKSTLAVLSRAEWYWGWQRGEDRGQTSQDKDGSRVEVKDAGRGKNSNKSLPHLFCLDMFTSIWSSILQQRQMGILGRIGTWNRMVLETKAWSAHKYSARKDQPLVPDELTPHGPQQCGSVQFLLCNVQMFCGLCNFCSVQL